MADKKLVGGCQCGQVRYVASGEPVMSAICHCAKCRRSHAAPTVAWAMFPAAMVTFTAGELKQYKSSDDAERGFCGNCGTQISFTASFLPDLIDISVGSLDEPASMPPQLHFWHSSRVPWAEYADDLPRHAELPPFGDGD